MSSNALPSQRAIVRLSTPVLANPRHTGRASIGESVAKGIQNYLMNKGLLCEIAIEIMLRSGRIVAGSSSCRLFVVVVFSK